ncbi:CMRF35-like molecule 5 isoform X2 [Narcine bancroftii]|uniref:CMRF35-like molecule 5 isoform X2 n=1 Tax=Narcine bancroftii TaxID=1343680 RepID=UPI0038319507
MQDCRLLLSMKSIQFTLILLGASLAAALKGPKQVFGTSGGAITIICRYRASSYKNYEKYLCKGSERKSCSIIARSPSQWKNIDNRVIIVDNQTTGEFSITISQLSYADSGPYWCGISTFGYDRMFSVRVNITKASTTPSPTSPHELWETVEQTNESITNLIILLGSIFGVLIIAAIFIARCRRYSADVEKGFRYIDKDSNPVYNSVNSRDDREGIMCDTATNKSSTPTHEDHCYICETSAHEQKEIP